MPPWSQEMSERGSLDGVQFKLQGVRSAASFWIWLPELVVVDMDAGNGQHLRVFMSQAVARANQQFIYFQGLRSVALALAIVLVLVVLILRRPRRSLVEARRYAQALPLHAPPPLSLSPSGLSDIDSLRDALNEVNALLASQRLQQQRTQEQLRAAAVQAREAAESKGRFLAHWGTRCASRSMACWG